MLPYTNNGGYGVGSYGRRKGFLSSQNTVTGVLVLVVVAALGFSVLTHFRASSANAQRAALKNELESVRSELHSIKSQYHSRNAELEQLQFTHGHTQRRMNEVSSQLQRKEAELVSKDQALQQHIKEKTVADQHRNGREAELAKMVEDLRAELMRSDGIIEALETKMAKMDATHASREKDWHTLANKWIKYEQDLHEEYRKCSTEVSNLRNLTMALNNTEPIPEAEPQLRPETDFAQIRTEIPAHKPHHFEPLPPPTPSPPSELPLPETKIRDSIVAMTGGKVGANPDQQAPPGGASAGDGHKAPEPTQVHHHDVYHHEFHEDAGHHHYDNYHGHYDSYDPMDEWWLHDAHGDWNADDPGHGHAHGGNGDDVHHHDQNQHDHPKHDEHQYQHDHHNQHDQQRHQYQEVHNGGWGSHQHPSPSVGDAHHYQHQQPQAMHGMEQHAPSPWQQHDSHHQQQQHHHEQYQQHYQQHNQDHQQQQHQQQQPEQHHQHYGEHQQHPKGDLAYKMGW